MSVLIGFAKGALLAEDIPAGIEVVRFGAVSALLSTKGDPAALPELSGILLRLQALEPVIPLRPAAPPSDMAGHVERLLPQLMTVFDEVGTCVEFVVTVPLPPLDEPVIDTKPSDYLRATQRNRDADMEALAAARSVLAPAIQIVETTARRIICGERNVKDLAAIHYLMKRDETSAVIAQWQSARALIGSAQATLAGPWAPYSFVSLA
jgi:Gas vesicle synthesis protein GvpL/GvpF